MITTAQIMGRMAHQAEIAAEYVHATPMPVEFVYDTDDPWAVRLVFGTGTAWLLGLELLSDGMRWPVGDGDVRLWPMGRSVMLRLRAPSGEALIALPLGEIAQFVDRAEALAGQQPEVSFDNELAELLGGA